MPKMKTKRPPPRLKVRQERQRKRGHATKRHILTKRTTKNKRQLRGVVTIHERRRPCQGHVAPREED